MTAKEILKANLPHSARRLLGSQKLSLERKWRRFWGGDLGLLHRRTPVNSQDYGESRGQSIDRYYIEKFLAACASDVRGHVLDFADDFYARKFGGAQVTQLDVLHLTPGNPRATIVADLAHGDQIPSGTFDCILCTQVLHCIYDCAAAVRTLHRILKPGGVVLVTAPGIQKVDSVDLANEEEFWRFTSRALSRFFEEVFPKEQVEVRSHGNVMAAIAFLHGLAIEDLRCEDLEYFDPDFEVSISLRAVK